MCGDSLCGDVPGNGNRSRSPTTCPGRLAVTGRLPAGRDHSASAARIASSSSAQWSLSSGPPLASRTVNTSCAS